MLSGGIPIGKAFGISLRLHYSWFVIFALITWALAASYYPTVYPDWSLSTKIAAGLVTSILFFASVLLHELMHSIVALRQGIHIQSITLFILGGVSQMTDEPKTPGDEFRMAIAGPGSSLVLGGIFWGIYFAVLGINTFPAQVVGAVAYWLGLINILLGLFNLIPGFPLDGGRVLRSILWWRRRDLRSSTLIAANVGRVFGFLFIFGGLYLLFTGNWLNGIWFALIGWFLQSAASGSYRQMLLQEMLKGHIASEIMVQDCMVVPPDITLDQLVNENMLASGRRCFPVSEDGQVEGLITLQDVRSVPRDNWNSKRVREAMTPVNNLKAVRPDEDLNMVLQIMTQNDVNQVPVIDHGKIVGMIGRDNLLNFINVRQELQK